MNHRSLFQKIRLILPAVLLSVILLFIQIPLPIHATTAADIISTHVQSKQEVYIGSQTYWIVTLTTNIDPTTLSPTAIAGKWKVYTDTHYNPVSDGEIARKIGTIDRAQLFLTLVAAGSAQTMVDSMNDELLWTGLMRVIDTLADQAFWGIGEFMHLQITAGTSFMTR